MTSAIVYVSVILWYLWACWVLIERKKWTLPERLAAVVAGPLILVLLPFMVTIGFYRLIRRMGGQYL